MKSRREERMRDLPVILFGVGGVGRALLRQILEHRSLHAIQYGLYLRLMAVCDRNGAVLEPSEGIDDDMLREIVALKESGGRLVDYPEGGPQGDSYSIVDIAGRAGADIAHPHARPRIDHRRDQLAALVLDLDQALAEGAAGGDGRAALGAQPPGRERGRLGRDPLGGKRRARRVARRLERIGA